MTPYSSRQRSILALILLAYLALGVAYALATPPFEASDEFKHYPVVQYVQTERRLPVLDPAAPGRWLQEAAQPPLYYLLMAALTAPIDTGDLPALHQLNLHAFVGNPNQVQNKNLIIHDPTRETFPWRGSVLAIYLIRFASLGLGVGTILLTAALGRRLHSPRVGLLAAALTAFNPMFLFVSAAVNNDSLAILLGQLGLLLLVQLWQEPPDPRSGWRRYAALGLVLGLGLLAKLSLGGLLLLAGLLLAWRAWRQRDWRPLALGGGLVALVALAVSGWWFLRNLSVYGDLTGLSAFVAVQGTRDAPIGWQDWVGEFGTFYRSYWGLFGGVNVPAPELFYTVCNLAAAAGLLGLLVALARRRLRPRGGLALLLAWAAVLFLLLLRWTAIYTSFQGRLLFPALGALNVLWALGLLTWTGERKPLLAWAAAGWLLLSAALLSWIAIRPAYAYPAPLGDVPEAARFGPVSFAAAEGEIQLVGVELAPGQRVTPAAEPVELVLYWRAAGPVTQDYVSTVHLLGRGLESVGQVNRYPGGGMWPTSRWRAGQIWRDVYHVVVRPDAPAPTLLRVSVGLYDTAAGAPLPAVGPDGAPLPLALVGEALLSPREQSSAEPAIPLDVALADRITLAGYALDPQPAAPGVELALTLFWQAGGPPARDYTVFVHLLAPGDPQPLATGDGPPLAGDYPTGRWQAGDRVQDAHRLTLPADLLPGDYQIAVGLYDPATGLRVARADGAGDVILLPLAVGAAP